jgi:outer membrane protein insertion porin family
MSNGRVDVVSSKLESVYKRGVGGCQGGCRQRAATTQNKGALRMKLGVGVLRRAGVAVLLVGGVLLGVLAGSLATAHPAAAQQIVVEGNRRVEASTIQSYFRLGPGERLDEIKINSAYKALIDTGLFQDVQIRRAGNQIIVTLVEAPVINRVAFEGNKRVKDEQLTPEIQSKARGTFSRAAVQADVQRILEIYRAAGRYDITVDPKIIELPNNRVDLVFEITEGPKTTVKHIVFVGNNAFSDRRLKDVIKTAETGILSFLKNNDLYDRDRLEADRELLRRFYLKNGYADVRVSSSLAEYDPARHGFVVTFTIEEGDLYRFGAVEVLSNVADINAGALRARLRMRSGAVYNAEQVEKTVEDMTVEMSKLGYAFAQVRPRGDRDFAAHIINVTFVVEQGARAYIERINIRGNTRTRDYVIRREFEIAEGDAYNRVLIDRAERRLKNLNYFKVVRITNEPGSAPDRVVVNVDVEEQSTGDFSIAGGYSTAQGFLAEVSVAERNLLGTGQFAKAAVQYGQFARGIDLSYADPYFLDYRFLLGVDLFAKQTLQNTYQSYESRMIGGGLRTGLALREDLGLTLRYSAYEQKITLPGSFNNCNDINPDFITSFPTPDKVTDGTFPVPPNAVLANCFVDGEASLAIKTSALQGNVWTSLVGYNLVFNTLDNNKAPTSGLIAELRQDFAGLGGDVSFLRTTTDWRYYYEVYSDIVLMLRAQGGNVMGFGHQSVTNPASGVTLTDLPGLRMLDQFFMGPNLVRGFAYSGIGPRDLTPGTNFDALGGTMYWGATAEVQFPIPGVPKDLGVRLAVFSDAGSLWNYAGPTQAQLQTLFLGQTIIPSDDSMHIRASVGAGILWDSPFGPLRLDYAKAFMKEDCAPVSVVGGPQCDKLQAIRFGGGTKF